MKILGIDPGSMVTGYGVITVHASRLEFVTAGTFKLSRVRALPRRIREAADGVRAILGEQQPDEVCMENIFQHASVRSALVLAQLRGALLLELARSDVPIFEYTPLEVKRALVGHGRADKDQVRRMVQRLLRLSIPPASHDASDALAVAICHAHTWGVRRKWERA